jgi:hypothetical protein
MRAAYHGYFAAQQQTLTALLRKCAVPLLSLTTSDDVAERLRTGLPQLRLPAIATAAGNLQEAA